jgi:cysteine-rich repeat protein
MYLLKRVLQMLVILAILSAALFGLLSSMPGNPIDLLITSNPNVKPEDIIRLRRLRGLDKPWYVQYARWLLGYPEPARPPVILPIEPIVGDESLAIVTIDLRDYLVDPNFIPSNEQLKEWLFSIWPQWEISKDAVKIRRVLAESDLSELLLLVARENNELQNQLVHKIERKSAQQLVITGLFGATTDGFIVRAKRVEDPHLWFKVSNSYGQEKIGRVAIKIHENSYEELITGIGSQVVENTNQPFSIDLKKFLIDSTLSKSVSFTLIDDSPGIISKEGIYTNLFRTEGQNVVLVRVDTKNGKSQSFGFDIEHGVIGRHDKFSRGFLYFFLGDKGALGFSQTYKRPVYDLLFGIPAVCGNGKIENGETCDDGNLGTHNGCGVDCFREDDSFFERADALISGYIVGSGRIGNTIQLMLPSLLLSLLLALPLGIFSAYRQYSVLDYVINFLAFFGISLPVFWFGIMMIYLFAENFQFFPAGGVQTPGIYGAGTLPIILDRLKHAILPTIVLSIFFVGRWLRYMRASMLEVLPKDYIRTARAKGLSEHAVILKHAFRNALIPVVTVLAISIPTMFGGAVLTETVFAWPGVGRMQYEAVMNSDYYVALIVFLIAAVLVMVGNLLADALYFLVDPRIRKQ